MDLTVIKEVIESRGIKQRWIAKEIGVHPSTLNRFLAGKTILSGTAMVRLFQLLKIDPSSLDTQAS